MWFHFSEKYKVTIMITFIQKWQGHEQTVKSINGETKNEIDFISVNKTIKKKLKSIIKDVIFRNKFNIGSNHTMAVCRCQIWL